MPWGHLLTMTIPEILAKYNLDHVNVYPEELDTTTVYRAAVMLAYNYSSSPHNVLDIRDRLAVGQGYGPWRTCGTSDFNWAAHHYRVKPSLKPKTMRPWRLPFDVPVEAEWIRMPVHPASTWRIAGYGLSAAQGVFYLNCGSYVSNDPFTDGWMWSDRERKVWHKCEVES